MNFQDYKAKYAPKAQTTAAAVETTTAKIDNAVKKGALKTKEAATTTGSALMGTLPVTTRKHNAFAQQINAELNGITRRLDRHDILFDVVAEGIGLNLPSNETMDVYLDEQAKAAVTEAETPVQEEMVATIVSNVLASLGLSNNSPLSAEQQAYIKEQQAQAPTIAQEQAEEQGEDTAAADAKAKKEQRRLAAIAKKAKEAAEQEEAPQEEVVKEQPEQEEKPAKSIKRRRKGGMGRQEPLAAE